MLAKLFSRFDGFAPLMLRLAIGAIFFAHGKQKLFGGLSGTEAMLRHIGIPIPEIMAVVLASVEFFGGICLILGLFTRPASLLLAADMIVAILKVHLHQGLMRGYEFPLSLLAGLIALLFMGPRKVSVERTILKREY